MAAPGCVDEFPLDVGYACARPLRHVSQPLHRIKYCIITRIVSNWPSLVLSPLLISAAACRRLQNSAFISWSASFDSHATLHVLPFHSLVVSPPSNVLAEAELKLELRLVCRIRHCKLVSVHDEFPKLPLQVRARRFQQALWLSVVERLSSRRQAWIH